MLVAGLAAGLATGLALAAAWIGASDGRPILATLMRPLPDAPRDGRERQALYLVRSTLMALQDANTTGNYSVLQALAAPGFQSTNSAAALAQIFAGLRERRVDLSVAAIDGPEWLAEPDVDAEGQLRLAGTFANGDGRLEFRLAYVPAGGEWRLMAISIDARPARP